MDRLGPCTVVLDPEPDHPVRSPLRTYLACLRAFPRGNTHLLIVQDDAWPCDDFRPQAEAFIAEHPESLCALFMPGGGAPGAAVRRALKARETVARLPLTWTPTVALSWPQEAAESFLAYAARYDPDHTRGDDGPVGHWRLATRTWPVVAPIPSLVQHPDVEPSLFRPKAAARGRNRARIAARYEG